MREAHLTRTVSQQIEISGIVPQGDDNVICTNAELISRLYDVADAPEGWSRFLGAILQSLPGSVAAIVTHSLTRHQDRLWGFHAIKVQLPSPAEGSGPGSAVSLPDLDGIDAIIPPSSISRLLGLAQMSCIEMVVDQPCLIHDYDVRRAAIGLCDRDADTLSYIIVGLLPCQIWGPERQATLEALLPHIAKIIRLRSLIERFSATATTADFALDRLQIGVITFHTTSSVPTLNLVANRLARMAPALLPHLQKLALSRLSDFRRMGQQAASAQLVKLPAPLNEMFRFAVMTEIRAQQPGTAALTFFVVSFNRHISIDIDALQRLFQLTCAEARIAALVVNGKHIDEIAESLAISFNTVRTHLHHIFEKTNVERQADLIHLLVRASIAINSST